MAIITSQWSHVLTIPESYTPSAATTGQTLVITESVISKLSAGDQTTFWSNVQNGGGDVRICESSDGTNQLPVEVVSLDNSAETCVIWTRKPSYDGTGSLYLFIGKAGETQPAVTDPFGRNAVWVDYLAVLHLNDASYTDSTGNGRNGTVVGSLSQTSSNHPFGSAWTDFSSSRNNALLLQNSGGILNNSFFHVKAWVKANVTGAGEFAGVISNRLDTDADNWFQVIQRGGIAKNDWQTLFNDGSGNSSDIFYDSPTLGDAELLTGSTNASSFDLRVNGSLATQSVMGGDGQLSSPNAIRVGNYFNGSLGFTGFIGEIRVALNSVSADKDATEYANQNDPAAFYGTPTLATTGGGVIDYTISIDAGSYSLQGSNLSLLNDRNLFIENGSYTLAGQELNLSLQRSMTLSQGVYAQQGTDTSLRVDRSLMFNTGDYLLEGSLLDLLLERNISLQSGEYNYVGSSINLQYGREFRLSLEQGSYSIQGSDALLLKDHIVSLESSFYNYSTSNISLLANRKITTDSGNYSYSGSPINFIYEAGGITYTLSLDSGSYNLTGESLGLLTSRRLPIDFGTYTYEGVNSNLLYNRVVALDSGVYTSAGTDLGIKVNRRLVFHNGNYSLQGTPITLSYTGEVLAILEGYRLSYKKHPIKQIKYKPYNITARYN